MTDKLLPCPFCCGEAIRCGNNDINPRHWIMCRDCHACPGGDVPDQAAAETAWNTRDFSPMTIVAGVVSELAANTPPTQDFEVLEEIKYLALTAGAPGHTAVPKALARMVGLCNRAGVTKKLDDLRPLFSASSEAE